VGTTLVVHRWPSLVLRRGANPFRVTSDAGPEPGGQDDPRRLAVLLRHADYRARALTAVDGTVLVYGEGFHEVDADGRRWIGSRARLGVAVPAAAAARLEFEAVAAGRPRRLTLAVEGRELADCELVATAFAACTFELPVATRNVALSVSGGEQRAGAGDERQVAAALRRVRVSTVPPP